MSVYALEGLPGSGKSLYVVSEIITPLLKARDINGRFCPTHIYHNLEGLNSALLLARIGVPEVYERFIHYLGAVSWESVDESTGEVKEHSVTEKERVRYFYLEPKTGEIVQEGAVFIIDEAQNFFNSRDFKDDYSRQVIDYMTRHRHYNHTIWWCTQNTESVDITFRRLTEQVLVLRRLENWGSRNSSQVQYFQGWDNRSGLAPFMKKKFQYNSLYFGTYSSYVPSAAEIKERRLVNNVWLNNKPLMAVVILFVLALLLIPFALYNTKKVFDRRSDKISSPHSTTPQPPPTQAEGFSPAAGGGGDSTGVTCIESEYTIKGINYVVVNGKSFLKDSGVFYEKCY